MKEVFGTYKTLMNTSTILGMIFATSEVVLYPNMHSYNAGCFFFSLVRPFDLSKEVVTVFLAGYAGIYASTISLLAVQFLYRYWAVFDQHKVERFFKGSKICIWFVYSLFFGVQWAFGEYYFVKLDKVSIEYFRDEIMLHYNENITDLPATSMFAYNPSDGSVRLSNLMCILSMTTIMNIQYSVILYCGWQMHAKMEEKIAHLSPSLRTHHKQFFKTLVLQITGPTVILFTPVMFIIYFPFLNLNISLPTGSFICGFTTYPAMDAIIAMCVVTEYRRVARKLFNNLTQRSKINTSTSAAPPAPRLMSQSFQN